MRFGFGAFELNLKRRELSTSGVVVPLEPKAFAVLGHLLAHRDRVVTKTELFDVVWPEVSVSHAVLTRCVRLIRQAVNDDGIKQRIIRTFRGYGYRFVAPVTILPAASIPASPLEEPAIKLPFSESFTQVVPAPVADQTCPRCQTSNRFSRQFCASCGHQLWQPCSHCGFVNNPAESFCGGCGLIRVAPSPPTSPILDAERRQLTVMFCDLVDAMSLAAQLDPEDLWEVVRAYQQTCADVVHGFDGYVAKVLGDALLVYFGWPQAHEDDAQRAVRSGLGMLEAMSSLNRRLEQEKHLRLAMRVGIHTGLVVFGDMGERSHHAQFALGQTPYIASSIQRLAEPDTVVISATTHRLVEGYFLCRGLGGQTLTGPGQAVPVYRVVGESGAQSRLDVATPRGLTPLVGREQEIALLRERWSQVKDGRGQVILLSGEAGIGKSRLVQVLKDHVTNEPHVRLECRSSPYYQNTALYPITDLLQRLLQWQPDDTVETKREKLAQRLHTYRLPVHETVPLLATLLSIPGPEDRYPPLTLLPQRQRQKTLEALVAMVLEHTEHQPVLFILEDLHWTDPSTLEWLDLLIAQTPTAALLTLLTCRPEFAPPWGLRTYLTPLALHRLTRSQIETMVQRITGGKTLPTEVMQHLVEKTDGVPLYIEEMTRAILEAGVVQATAGHYALTGPLSALAIPTTLHDALMARLDRLGTAKGIAQLGATIGRQFDYMLLRTVSPVDEGTLQRELRRLVEAELVYQRGAAPQATYTFKHALIRDTAYQSLLRRTRQQIHQRIAQALEAEFPEIAVTQAELLAHHFTEAGLHAQAVDYWYKAGQHASGRSAHVEAVAHCTKGLEVLKTLPETAERARQELALQSTLGPSLFATRGPTVLEVGGALNRARQLCEYLGDTIQLSKVITALFGFHGSRGELLKTLEVGEYNLRLAQREGDTFLASVAHSGMGFGLFFRGDLVPARSHFEQALALSDPQQHSDRPLLGVQDPLLMHLSYLAWTLVVLGYPDQAIRRSREALTRAQELAHPYSLVHALIHAAHVGELYREAQSVQKHAEAAIAVCNEQGFAFWLMVGIFLRGWALHAQGLEEVGLDLMHQGSSPNERLMTPYLRARLAEAHATSGQTEEGLTILEAALDEVSQSEGRFYTAELHRLKGELLLRQAMANAPQAEACFYQALDLARRSQAKWWELRAATSLARLWQAQDKHQDAYDLLAPVYGWFTEGVDTVDVQEAKALLEELRE
jgi:class 3 adenylate cyclase/DNA-binding winged helix-turn-helix (wHTH) protein/predicted ATPase